MRSTDAQLSDNEFRSILQKFRDEPLDSLAFTPAIELLLDPEHCRTINKLVRPTDTLWERLKALPDTWAQLPDEGGIYMFVWVPQIELHFAAAPDKEKFFWVVYVGKAGKAGAPNGTIRRRYQSEYTKYVARDPSDLWSTRALSSREERLARYLTLRPLELWYLTMEDESEIALLERRLLRLLRPPLNYQYGPKIRPGKTQPAF